MSLYQFLATNFHQDWDFEADDWEGVVDNYVNEDPAPEPLRILAREIDNLRETRTEQDLRQFLVRTVGVDYLPETLTYNEWLGQVAGRLRQHSAAVKDDTAYQT